MFPGTPRHGSPAQPAGESASGADGLRARVTRDGSSGYLAEAGRYQLYVSLACPWSHRVIIVRRLLGLEQAVGLSITDPIRDERGWRFPASSGGRDPLTGAQSLSELYLATAPGYTGRFTVPCLWDARTQRIISNDVSELTLMLESEFRAYQRPGAPDLYPADLRADIDALNTLIYHAISNGVYEAGLAQTQAEYESAFDRLFATLAALEDRLATRRFLLGGRLTEADVRLYPTLARFDAVYYTHFKCNLHRLTDYPNLWGYARDLYQQPGFGDTTDFAQIKRHYYQSQDWLNPSRIVPKGPYVNWLSRHDRDRPPGGS